MYLEKEENAVPYAESKVDGNAMAIAVSILEAAEAASAVKSYPLMPTPTPADTFSPTGFTRVEGDWMPRARFSADSRQKIGDLM